MDKLCIVHVAPCYVDINNETGGVANVVRKLCLQQVLLGHEVSLVCTTTELNKQVVVEVGNQRVECIDRYVIFQRNFPLFGPFSNIIKAINMILVKHKNKQCIFHVHTCFSPITELVMFYLKRKNIPYIFTPHGKLAEKMIANRKLIKTYWWKLIAKYCINYAAATCYAAKLEGYFFDQLGIKTQKIIIPNAYEKFLTTKPLDSIYSKYIIFFGYIDPRKQPDFLLRAYALSETRHAYKLVFVGPDKFCFQSVIQKLAQELRITDKIIFHGPAYGHEKWTLLKHASCLCLPAKAEGMPIVLCEALGSGLPTVYSEGCNFPEIADAGAGLQVSGWDELAWAQAIDSIVLNSDRRRAMSLSAIQLSAQYEWGFIIQKWIDAYRIVLTDSDSSHAA